MNEFLLCIARIDSNCKASDCGKPISVGDEFAWQQGRSLHVACAAKLYAGQGIVLKPGPSLYGH